MEGLDESIGSKLHSATEYDARMKFYWKIQFVK